MASNKTNRVEVPEAKAAMDRFKTEVASELGVNLKEGYNGDLTSKGPSGQTHPYRRRICRMRNPFHDRLKAWKLPRCP